MHKLSVSELVNLFEHYDIHIILADETITQNIHVEFGATYINVAYQYQEAGHLPIHTMDNHIELAQLQNYTLNDGVFTFKAGSHQVERTFSIGFVSREYFAKESKVPREKHHFYEVKCMNVSTDEVLAHMIYADKNKHVSLEAYRFFDHCLDTYMEREDKKHYDADELFECIKNRGLTIDDTKLSINYF